MQKRGAAVEVADAAAESAVAAAGQRSLKCLVPYLPLKRHQTALRAIRAIEVTRMDAAAVAAWLPETQRQVRELERLIQFGVL